MFRRFVALVILAVLFLAGTCAGQVVSAAEREALGDLYMSLGGSAWSNRGNWNDLAVSPCSWYGVSCDVNPATGTGVVTALRLPRNNLRGALPASISQLSALVTVEIPQNRDLTGTIPSSIGSLQNLEHFNAAECNIYGDIPPGFFTLSKLKTINFGDIILPIDIPGTGGVHLLGSFTLGSNVVTGNISDFLTSFPRAQVINLFATRVTGDVDDRLCELTDLVIFSVRATSTGGYIPDCIGNLTHLERFQLESNLFQGTIPAGLFSDHIRAVSVANQPHMGGPVPSTLANATNLAVAFLSAVDGLNGTFPIFHQAMPALRSVALAYSSGMQGGLPPSLCRAVNLELILFAFLGMTGDEGIPRCDSWTQVNNMMIAPGTMHRGPIDPDILRGKPLLRSFALICPFCDPLGTIPGVFQSSNIQRSNIVLPLNGAANLDLPNAIEILLMAQNVTLNLAELCRSPSAVSMTVELSVWGTVPDCLATMTQLKTLKIRGSDLSGTLPSSLAQLTGLRTLETKEGLMSLKKI